MNNCLQEILRCPITKEALRLMSTDEICEVNNRISKGKLFHFDGEPALREISSGLVCLSGRFGYPVEEDIVILLPTLAIVLDKDGIDGSPKPYLRKEKKDVQDFYDQIGWQKAERGLFVDTLKFVDLRAVCRDYHRKCQMRVNRHLKPSGRYILDAASGPGVDPDHPSYQRDFGVRICVDLSFLALKQAKEKLGDRGVYLLADVTNLPLRDNLVDAAVSLHTIYHVPADEQKTAFEEIYRVLKPACTAVVVYSWGSHSFLMNLAFLFLPLRVFKAIRKRVRVLKTFISRKKAQKPTGFSSKISEGSQPKLYFYAHNYRYFASQKWPFDLDIRAFRSVSPLFTKTYVHRWLLGRQFLALVYWLEERLPYIAGRLGQYPLFIIRK
jgi:ubiquinone/menaquinone biosynthesis C-methylase UbiE/uncharacterized protein YbaR (Trm112 family)